MHPKYESVIGCDFIAADQTRITCYQLVGEENGRKAAFAIINFTDGKITRENAINSLKPRMGAIRRLARKVIAGSTPVRFGKAAA